MPSFVTSFMALVSTFLAEASMNATFPTRAAVILSLVSINFAATRVAMLGLLMLPYVIASRQKGPLQFEQTFVHWPLHIPQPHDHIRVGSKELSGKGLDCITAQELKITETTNLLRCLDPDALWWFYRRGGSCYELLEPYVWRKPVATSFCRARNSTASG